MRPQGSSEPSYGCEGFWVGYGVEGVMSRRRCRLHLEQRLIGGGSTDERSTTPWIRRKTRSKVPSRHPENVGYRGARCASRKVTFCVAN
jgi:hypothetical protein